MTRSSDNNNIRFFFYRKFHLRNWYRFLLRTIRVLKRHVATPFPPFNAVSPCLQLQRIVRRRHVRRLANIEEEKTRRQLATWVAAVAIQRLWRGLVGRKKFGQVRASGSPRHELLDTKFYFFPLNDSKSCTSSISSKRSATP